MNKKALKRFKKKPTFVCNKIYKFKDGSTFKISVNVDSAQSKQIEFVHITLILAHCIWFVLGMLIKKQVEPAVTLINVKTGQTLCQT